MVRECFRYILPILLLGMFAAGPAACDSTGPDACVCTEEFRSFTVKLVDSDGAVVSGVQFEVTILRTGEKVDVVEWVPGVYTVFDDNFADQIIPNEIVRVVAIRDGSVTSARFIFTVDVPCRCHVQKLSGPDVIVLKPPGD